MINQASLMAKGEVSLNLTESLSLIHVIVCQLRITVRMSHDKKQLKFMYKKKKKIQVKINNNNNWLCVIVKKIKINKRWRKTWKGLIVPL